MTTAATTTLFGARFGQICWVVPDIKRTEKFFLEKLGVPKFLKLEGLPAKDLNGTYMGKPADFVFDLFLSYSGETMIEIIQPRSGKSMYTDYLEKNPSGGVQHIAFTVPESKLDAASAQMKSRGFKMIQGLTLSVARVEYFDTYRDLGVATEIIGATPEGFALLDQLKYGDY